MGLLYKKQITMKKIKIITLLIFLYSQAYSQNIAYMKMPEVSYNGYLNNAIVEALKKNNINAKPFSNTQLFQGYDNSVTNLTNDQIANLKMFNHDYIILHKSEKTKQTYFAIGGPWADPRWESSLREGVNWQSEFYVFNVNTNQSTVITLAISTFDCGNNLETCSNIAGFVKQVKDFVQGGSSNITSNEAVSNNNTITNSSSTAITKSKKKKSIFGSSSNAEGKFKVVRVKEKNTSNNTPVSIDIYDKSLSLKVGDNIVLTRTDEVQIPGERKKIKSEKTIGKAKIIDDFNKPLYTAKLSGTAVVNFKDYKDGDENYTAVKGEDSKEIASIPKIMVIPEKIDPNKLTNGEYQLSKEEILIIGALKNKLENKNYTTNGFETAIKKVYEDRLVNENTQVDLKSLILESSGADFYVEFKSIYDLNKITYANSIVLNNGVTITKTEELIEGNPKWISSSGKVYKELNKNEAKEKVWSNLNDVIYLYDQSRDLMFAFHNNGNGKSYSLELNKNPLADYVEKGTGKLTKVPSLGCNQNFNFKIRNYATNEDVATDIKQLNTCGSPEDYKSFAESILNEGALNKMNAQFKDILKNGKKISVNFTILNSSSASFDKTYNGNRLEEHIQNAIQAYSLTYRQNGVVNKRMTFSEVYIPSVNENNGQNNYPNDFALSVIKYLKEVVSLECEKTVIGQNVNINIK